MATQLTSDRIDEIVDLLGLEGPPPADADGLHLLYSAWCRRVPFDNLTKLIALGQDVQVLPGIEPRDFFATWQETGAGSTCWATNNALHALLVGVGFDAQRWSASMFDGPMNHGTTVVTIDGHRWLVDTAVHGDVPAPLIEGTATSVDHAGYRTTVRSDAGGFLFDLVTPDPAFTIPCRILEPIDHETTVVANEKSREWSPFNDGIMAAINDATGTWMLNKTTLTRIDEAGTTSRELTVAEVDRFLIDTCGHSPDLTARVRQSSP